MNPFTVCPIKNPIETKNNFGAKRAGHTHYGVGILAEYGAPIYAPFSGIVTNPKSTAGGLTVILKRSRLGRAYVLGHHLSKHGPSGKVQAGDIIGYVGRIPSPNNEDSQPHLHFEWHPNGKGPVDSYPLLVELGCI